MQTIRDVIEIKHRLHQTRISKEFVYVSDQLCREWKSRPINEPSLAGFHRMQILKFSTTTTNQRMAWNKFFGCTRRASGFCIRRSSFLRPINSFSSKNNFKEFFSSAVVAIVAIASTSPRVFFFRWRKQ